MITPKSIADLLARILISLIFLSSGVGKIFGFSSTVGYMQQNGMTFATPVFLAGAIVFLLTGSALIIVGYKPWIGSALLIAFLIPASLIFHWEFDDRGQTIQFMKNLGLIGGLIMVGLNGVGALSLQRFLDNK